MAYLKELFSSPIMIVGLLVFVITIIAGFIVLKLSKQKQIIKSKQNKKYFIVVFMRNIRSILY